IRILHNLANVDVPARKMQVVFCLGICWKPIFTVHLLTVGDKRWKQILFALLPGLRHILAVRKDDLHILLIDKDSPLKIALALLNLLWRHIENVGVQFIDFLLSNVIYLVISKVLGRQDKRQTLLDVVDVLARHLYPT